MRVRFTQDHGGRRAGTTHDLPDEQAKRAVEDGAAEELGAAPAATDKDGNAGMRLRFRRPATVGGQSHAAGSAAFVPVTDDAWEAVNRGDADLDPAPGEKLGNGVQPFPPEWVGRSEATEARHAATPATSPVPVRGPAPAGRTPAKQPATPETVGRDPHTPKK